MLCPQKKSPILLRSGPSLKLMIGWLTFAAVLVATWIVVAFNINLGNKERKIYIDRRYKNRYIEKDRYRESV